MNFPKLAVFDMDGLLFDTERVLMEANAKVMKAHGYEQKFSDYQRTMGTAGATYSRMIHEIYGQDYPLETVSAESRRGERDWLNEHGVPVKPGIPELLRLLAAHGVPCCMATSTRREEALKTLEDSGLAPCFSFIVAGDEVVRSKPDPEVHFKVCQKAGVSPADALVFEDSENGVRAAHNAGVPVVCIPDLVQPSEDIVKQAAAVVPSAWEAMRLFPDDR